MSGSIKLTKKEDELFTILRQTLIYCDLNTTLRCAGGWVRDKLLNLESDDIDIALDDTFGKQFGEHINRYLESQNTLTHRVSRSELILHTASTAFRIVQTKYTKRRLTTGNCNKTRPSNLYFDIRINSSCLFKI